MPPRRIVSNLRCNVPLTALLSLFVSINVWAGEGPLILSMDEIKHVTPKQKASAELVEGKVGKAVKFSFDKDSSGVFFTTNVRGNAEWDKAEGFSFWVRGYGVDGFGGLEFIWNDDFAIRYDLCFPVKGTEWTKISVDWRDLTPVMPKGELLDPKGDFKPSTLLGPWVGKWWYWRDYPAVQFALDEIRLEAKIQPSNRETKTTDKPLVRVREKLKAGKPITIVTMGDSLTDYRHWANRKVSWPLLLRDKLKSKYKSEVTVVNPAIGGTELRQNLVLMPRWLSETPEPDLVTICFGGNDWNSGMRGEMFARSTADAVRRIRRATNCTADVLLMTTVPGLERWQTYAELSEAVRKVAKSHVTGLADTEKAFHAVGDTGRVRLFVDDKVHLAPAGHTAVVDAILDALEKE